MPSATARLPLLLAGTLLLAACGPGREYRQPDVAPLGAWHHPAPSPSAIADRWWTAFDDPRLDRLVDAVVAANLEVRQAAARIEQALAARGVALQALAPVGGVGASAERYRAGRSDPAGGDGRLAIGVDAAWELDLFGGLRRGVEAADAELSTIEAEGAAVLAAVVAETVRAYVDLLAANEVLGLLHGEIADRRQAHALLVSRRAAGLAGPADEAQAAAQLAGRMAELPAWEGQRSGALARLAILLARPANALFAEAGSGVGGIAAIAGAADLPAPTALLAAGVPADLLRKRPDLRRAERRLAAAVARIGVAEHDLYPRLSLSGSFGIAGADGGDLDGSGRFWAIGPVLRWPLLDLPRVRARAAAAEAAAREAELAYRAAVLAAVAEVEAALAGLQHGRREVEAGAAAVAALSAVHLSTAAAQRAGAADRLRLLADAAALAQARVRLAEARRQQAHRAIVLAKALGGGWTPSRD